MRRHSRRFTVDHTIVNPAHLAREFANRDANDWLLLAQYERARGNQANAVEALEAAVRINTWLPDVHKFLMQHYQQQGNLGRSDWHRARAVTP